MADEIISIEVEGLDTLLKNLDKLGDKIPPYMRQAGEEAATRVVLKTQGLKRYPPLTSANKPPTPYYIRGRGMQYKRGNNLSSERLGTQFYVESRGFWSTAIGNRASYAKYVVGEQQAHFMEPKGWRKLKDVAQEKMSKIKAVYDAWVKKAIRDLGL